jgi:hypothetical protein
MPEFAETSVGRGAHDETGFCVPRAGVDPTIPPSEPLISALSPAHTLVTFRAGTEAALAPAAPTPVGGSEPEGETPRDAATLPQDIRPRSRLFAAGAEALSAAEFLAELLCTFPGTNEKGALDLAVALLIRRGGLHGLLRSSPREISGVAGIGEAKASVIVAAAELGK